MSEKKALENSDRLRLGMLNLLSGRSIEFSQKNSDLIVVFNFEPNYFSKGKIALLQQFIFERTGITASIQKQIPACVKVFFSLDIDTELEKSSLEGLLRSDEFLTLCKALEVSQVQFFGQIFRL